MSARHSRLSPPSAPLRVAGRNVNVDRGGRSATLSSYTPRWQRRKAPSGGLFFLAADERRTKS